MICQLGQIKIFYKDLEKANIICVNDKTSVVNVLSCLLQSSQCKADAMLNLPAQSSLASLHP